MASAESSSLTDAGCVQSICTDPIRRTRWHISFRFASSRCDSRSSISTNGLRVEPGRARLLAARFKRCAASTVPEATSTTMRAPNWRAIVRSTTCCKLRIPSAELRPAKKERDVKARTTPIKKTRRDRQLFIWNNTKALFEHLTKFLRQVSQSKTGRVAYSEQDMHALGDLVWLEREMFSRYSIDHQLCAVACGLQSNLIASRIIARTWIVT